MKLDFLICGTPNDAFCSQIAFFRICLDRLGGIYKDARLVATFGDHIKEEIPLKWVPYFENIQIEWSYDKLQNNISHSAQHYHRYELIRPDADMAILVDADTLLFRPFPELIKKCMEYPALYGVIAHQKIPIEKSWQEISQHVLGREIQINHSYTIKPGNGKNETPFYINYGFLAGPPHLLKQACQQDILLLEKTAEIVGPFFCSQVSLALAIDELSLPHEALPMRYNYPNDRNADSVQRDEMDKIILLHYLRTSRFDRHKIFSCQIEFDKFIQLDLVGSDELFKQHVISVTNGQYPF